MQWQSEQEKQESKSIYAGEKEVDVKPVKRAIEPVPEASVATA